MPFNVLLLQGPVGPFFERYARELEQSGHTVYKINFNGGDELYYSRKNTIPFRGRFDDWRDFLGETLSNLKIKQLFMYGEHHEYHATAIRIAHALGVRVFVFGDGYLRPECVSLQEINPEGQAALPRRPALYPYSHRATKLTTPKDSGLPSVGELFWYNLATTVFSWRYPHYRHPFKLGLMRALSDRLVGVGVKFRYGFSDPERGRKLARSGKQYFVCPLQPAQDQNVKMSSRFKNMDEFIQDIIHSFAGHAPEDSLLVFRHPPEDMGNRDYSRQISVLSNLHNVSKRVLYLRCSELDELLRGAEGTVTINSPAGLRSLGCGVPVKTLGHAIYNIEGLVYQETLDRFWHVQGSVDHDLFERFRNYLLTHIETNGSFYSKISSVKSPTGMRWHEDIAVLMDLKTITQRMPQAPISKPLPPVTNNADLGKHYNRIDTTEDDVDIEAVDEPVYHPLKRQATTKTEKAD